MNVELIITPSFAQINNLTDASVIRALDYKLSYIQDSARYSMQFKTGGWDGRTKLLTRTLKFPAGCTSLVLDVLKQNGITPSVIDERITPSHRPIKWQGHKLFDYQNDVVDKALDAKRGMVRVATGGGKAQPLTSKVVTPFGMKEIGSLVVGDKVISKEGRPVDVLGVFPQGKKDIWKITFSDGSFTRCCNEHLWAIIDIDGKTRVKDCQQLRECETEQKIPMCAPVEFYELEYEMAPYMAGLVFKNNIPEEYLFTSLEERVELLQSIMDSNGFVINSTLYIKCSQSISSSYITLIQSLGGTGEIDGESLNNKEGDIMIKVHLPPSISPFLMKKVPRGLEQPTRSIVSIVPDGHEEAICISVEGELYLTDNYIVTHNTTIISKLVSEINCETVIYVVTLDLLAQMTETLSEFTGQKIGVVGDGVCDIQKITVCSVWSAGRAFAEKQTSTEEDVKVDKWKPSKAQAEKIKNMVSGAKVVILDESQFAAASSIQSIMKNSHSAVYKWGFSGTPWRTDGADILLTAAFGDLICKITASELIDKGYLVMPKIAFKAIPEFEYEIKKDWKTVYYQYIVHNKERNQIISDNIKRLLDMGRKPLVMFRELAHGDIIEDLLDRGCSYRKVTGKLSKEERDEIRHDFKKGEIDLLLASTVYDQGVDITNIDSLLPIGGGKSSSKALQRLGRALRNHPGKKDALVMETYDQCYFTKKHSVMRYRAYASEPRFKISVPKEMKSSV